MARGHEEILRLVQENRKAMRGYGVRKIGLFGSFVRDQGSEESDIDFLVEFEKKSFDAYMGLKLFLEDLFQCKVDLVLPNTIKPRLRNTILSETVYASGL